MINLVSKIPKISLPLAEVVKINCTYNSYKDIAMFWVQNQNSAIISLLDGNMTIYNNGADTEELCEFINVISPLSVFSDADTLTSLFKNAFHRVCVMKSEHRFESDVASDTLNSSEIYKLLDIDGLELPPYEHFAVDFCYRLNHGQLKYFALRTGCAAVAVSDGQATLLNGIASHQKGMGSVALGGVLAGCDMPCLAVCEEKVMPFYLKNNFSYAYDAGDWRKNP
ncbi:MAG: hypothetical protein IJZ21_02480 [Clostridia bacterium]|nr:hypothetical protein [Clostridia bacterium]